MSAGAAYFSAEFGIEQEKGLFVYEGTIVDMIDALWHSNANVRVTPLSTDFGNDF